MLLPAPTRFLLLAQRLERLAWRQLPSSALAFSAQLFSQLVWLLLERRRLALPVLRLELVPERLPVWRRPSWRLASWRLAWLLV
jgi:hypothetical protein